MLFSRHLVNYYRNLRPPRTLPGGIQWLYPQQSEEVMKVVEAFCDKFFHDSNKRRLMLGINPGRFGAGITGVNFTAAKQLEEDCGIAHPFPQGTELSAAFIYDMINAYGGPAKFYAHNFIGSVCPLGFVQGGKNLNYYDDPQLYKKVRPFIIRAMDELLSFGMDQTHCICIGGEKNLRHLVELNNERGWFQKISPVPHPRFIMQYRRSQKEQFIQQYLQLIN